MSSARGGTRWLSCLAIVLLTAISTRAHSQIPPVRDPIVRAPARATQSPTRVMGVYDEDSGQPLAGVEVMDMATGTFALTTNTGTVSLGFMSAEGGQVRIRKLGYAVQTMLVPAADTNGITVTLKHVAELPAVVTKDSSRHYISPALRGFEERLKTHASGYFIDEATLRKEDGRPLGNVLVGRAPGAIVKQASGSAMFLLKSPRCSNGGQPDVYVDGVMLAHMYDPRYPLPGRSRKNDDPRDYPIDLSQFQVSDLAAVEYYPDNATMPVQFSRTSAGCGALMLWTRER